MHVLLFLGGLISLAAGGVALGFATIEFRAGHESLLLVAGTVGVIGSLALLGLGAIALRVARLAEMLETQPIPRSVAVPPPDGSSAADAQIAELGKVALPLAPQTPSSVESAAPRGGAPEISVEPLAVPPAPLLSPEITTPSRAPTPGEPTTSTLGGTMPRLDNAPVPTINGQMGTATDFLRDRDSLPAPAPSARIPHVPTIDRVGANEDTPHALKSGVIEGMAYTLYSNGAVDAELPRHGTMRFSSIAEWRAYIRSEQ